MVTLSNCVYYQPDDLLGTGLDESLPPEQLATIFEWAKTYLSKPDNQLGREGPVCPFVPTALRKNHFYISELKTTDRSFNELKEELEKIKTHFIELAPKEPPDSIYKTVLAVMPDFSQPFSKIDELQNELKPIYVSQGLMIGQFYKGCKEPGLWSDTFRPLQSPIPLLAIRHMVPSDFPFLHGAKGNSEMLLSYFKQFGGNLPTNVINTLVDALNNISEKNLNA